jgi:putative endonuclease
MWSGDKSPAVYIMASRPNGTLYIGVTSDLHMRVREHKTGKIDGFTKKYGVKTLVYYECYSTMDDAILRESRLKKWKRLWKIRLIEQVNPTWSDLLDERLGLKAFGPSGLERPDSDLLGWPPARP